MVLDRCLQGQPLDNKITTGVETDDSIKNNSVKFTKSVWIGWSWCQGGNPRQLEHLSTILEPLPSSTRLLNPEQFLRNASVGDCRFLPSEWKRNSGQTQSKTQFIWLGTKHSLAKRETDRLYSLLPSLTELTSVRNLGFIIDQELNMKDHITKLCQSCYYQLRQIRTVRHSLTSSAIQTLVHAFICTRVDFSNSLLYGTSAYLLDRLQSVLNSAAQLILRIGKYDPISAAIRQDLHWLPVPFRIRYKLNSITSNCLAGRAPEYLIELCHAVNDIPARRNLRSSYRVQLLVPRYRKERSGKRGFSVSSPQLWNLLPADIRLLHNDHQLFRKRLKTHYMQQSMLCHWGSMSTVWTLLLLLLQTCELRKFLKTKTIESSAKYKL